MPNNILLIFEGKIAEAKIYKNIHKIFFEDHNNTVFYASYNASIYSLYKELQGDPFLDTFELVKDKNSDKKLLFNLNRDDISQIFLFFDYDGHCTNADDCKIMELLDIFNEETEHGKLYISYPMLESIKDFSNTEHYKNCTIQKEKFIDYKKIVSSRTLHNEINKITKEELYKILKRHLMKVNCLINNNYEEPVTADDIDFQQKKIFDNQKKKYISINRIMIMSAFPFFIMEYFGYSKFIKNT